MERERTQTHRGAGVGVGKSSMTIETEIGAMKPQAKECREPPETGRGKERLSPRAFGRSIALPTPWASRTVRE